MTYFSGTAAAIGAPLAAFLIAAHPALAEPGAQKSLTVQQAGCRCGRGHAVAAGPPGGYYGGPAYGPPAAAYGSPGPAYGTANGYGPADGYAPSQGYGPLNGNGPNGYGSPQPIQGDPGDYYDDFAGSSPGVPPAPIPDERLGPPPGTHGPPAGPGLLGSNVNPHTDGPPPGNIGTTYRRSSRKIPSDKHPRIAMLDVSVENAYDVWVDGFKSYRTKDGVWHLESKEPLVPGVPHVYNVRSKMGEEEDAPFEYRTVRLIPGRIIDLQW